VGSHHISNRRQAAHPTRPGRERARPARLGLSVHAERATNLAPCPRGTISRR
jgi:hypothetical protein